MQQASEPILLDVALQGGGAHGAFTWGVLDRLLEEEDISIAAVSGASAGAMNAVVLASSLATDGSRAGARAALAELWRRVHDTAHAAQPLLGLIETMPWAFAAAGQWWSALTGGMVSISPIPAMGGPVQDSLRRMLEELVDFEALRAGRGPQTFISATNATTGAARIFTRSELSADVVLASACLPQAFPPVTIDGTDYWDGGYSSNPPLIPLVRHSAADDLLIVTVTPIVRRDRPDGPEMIAERINELTFNHGLSLEMRGLALLKEELGGAGGDCESTLVRGIQALRIHEIHDDARMTELDSHTKLFPVWSLLTRLHANGRAAAEDWLASHRGDLGVRSSAVLADRYL